MSITAHCTTAACIALSMCVHPTLAQEASAGAKWKFQQLHDFACQQTGDPCLPQAEMILGKDGALYGTTYRAYGLANGDPDGAVFKVSQSGKSFKVVHGLVPATDGCWVDAGVVQASDGELYGAASWCGPHDAGTLFRVSPSGRNFEVLHAFDTSVEPGGYPSSTLIQASDGWLYGTADAFRGAGSVFRMSLDGVLQFIATLPAELGAFGRCGVIEGSDGLLYGMTCPSFTNEAGAAFSMSKDGTLVWTHQFNCNDDIGCMPNRKFVEINGTLYGATSYRNGSYVANLFGFDSAGEATLLYELKEKQGLNVPGPLVADANGRLVGTTNFGGPGACMFSPYACGTVFAFTPATGALEILHAFHDPLLGRDPYAGVTIGSDGTIMGTTRDGGSSSHGNVFRLRPPKTAAAAR